jgi:hypothetical protein
VSAAELEDIGLVKGFRPGGLSPMETKLFATSASDARRWGRQLYPDGVFRVVEVEIPEPVAQRLYHGEADGRAVVGVSPELQADFNAAAHIRVLRQGRIEGVMVWSKRFA